MAAYNKVILVGNLTRDPELRRMPDTNTAVAKMGLAISEKYRDKLGEMKETVCFVDVEAWGSQGENCDKYLSKGSPILVDGALRLDQWENDQGQKRSRHFVRAQRVQFLGSPSGGGQSRSESSTATETAPQAAAPAAKERAADVAAEDNDDDMPF